MTDNIPERDSIIDVGQAPQGRSNVPARQDEILVDKIYLLPVSDRPFFPAQTQPVITNAEHWLETIERVGRTPQSLVGLCLTHNQPGEFPIPAEFPEIGTAVRVHNPTRLGDHLQFIAEGMRRFRIIRWICEKPPYLVQVQYPEPSRENPNNIKAYGLAIINTIKELLPHNPADGFRCHDYQCRRQATAGNTGNHSITRTDGKSVVVTA